MDNDVDIRLLQEKLIKSGFSGLYVPGECACELSDLAPCGEDPSLCEFGYKHINPDDKEEFMVSGNRDEPIVDWDKMRYL
jgi:hypothetical protein